MKTGDNTLTLFPSHKLQLLHQQNHPPALYTTTFRFLLFPFPAFPHLPVPKRRKMAQSKEQSKWHKAKSSLNGFTKPTLSKKVPNTILSCCHKKSIYGKTKYYFWPTWYYLHSLHELQREFWCALKILGQKAVLQSVHKQQSTLTCRGVEQSRNICIRYKKYLCISS